ncbi:hypothetical protein AJ80_00667 [Polytolypa hystricis UAMH7299]|uniref:F-box domain-containing protein n=1 Tax=Polytolypa hystricis (strain UAMH7299) TaxID=1447883 RepID=A0A2B7Z346_POLH7|nr:hypothetical protein AJ80_00667 [Polytolypa hystricis UAMH7299]
MLGTLPTELLFAIVKNISSNADLFHLALVSKRIYGVAIEALCTTAVVTCDREHLTNAFLVPNFEKVTFAADGSKGRLDGLLLAKDLCFYAPVDKRFRNECYTCPSLPECITEEIGTFSTTPASVLSSLKPNTLRSFSWELGTCVNADILGSSGYIPTHQRGIEKLTLVTDVGCALAEGGLWGLPHLRNIRHLSWRRIRLKRMARTLQRVLEANSERLEYLELGIIPYECVGDNRHLILHVLRIILHSPGIQFSCLRDLSLSNVSFLLDMSLKRLVSAFQLTKLRSLKLHFCQGAFNVLNCMISGQPRAIMLKCLEISTIGLAPDESGTTWCKAFSLLQLFGELEALYLYIAQRIDPEILSSLYLLRQPTLKRLVLHDNSVPLHPRLKWFTQLRCLNWRNHLECLGIGISPLTLAKREHRKVFSDQLKFLHFRTICHNHADCPDPTRSRLLESFVLDEFAHRHRLRENHQKYTRNASYETLSSSFLQSLHSVAQYTVDFAEWAFGPDGYHHLSILAYGDFSYRNRHRPTQVLLCRKSRPTLLGPNGLVPEAERRSGLFCQVMTGDDFKLWGNIEGAYEMLSVCPSEQILS